ncbi:MAG: hypothetical protein HC806_09520 [Anaerolineae bacterium]|nr:hypothetical protein [Anaerolineae bacterium]
MLVAMLYISGRYFERKWLKLPSELPQQTGITKSTSENRSLVQTVNVVPGMQVKEGDKLIELTSASLEVEMAKLTNRIGVLKSERAEKAKLANAEISYIKAQNSIILEELEAEILQTTAEKKMNEALTKEFVQNKTTDAETPVSIKINSLQAQKKKHIQAMNIKIEDVQQESKPNNNY